MRRKAVFSAITFFVTFLLISSLTAVASNNSDKVIKNFKKTSVESQAISNKVVTLDFQDLIDLLKSIFSFLNTIGNILSSINNLFQRIQILQTLFEGIQTFFQDLNNVISGFNEGLGLFINGTIYVLEYIAEYAEDFTDLILQIFGSIQVLIEKIGDIF